MLIEKISAKSKKIKNCHDGSGSIDCLEYLAEYNRIGSGVKFIHDNLIEVGASVGEHKHSDDEEVYIILSGKGTMKIDGQVKNVATGDICLTRKGNSHSLQNSSDSKMRLLVIGINV